MNMSSAPTNPKASSPIQRTHNEFNLQQAFTAVHGHCSSLLHNLSRLPDSLASNLQSSLRDVQNQATHALDAGISNFKLVASPAGAKSPVFARVADVGDAQLASVRPRSRGPMSVEEIQERLAGVPVYALSNSSEEFVLVSGVSTRKSLGLFCFKEEDAEALLEQMKSMEPGMRSGSRVVPVALNKIVGGLLKDLDLQVFQLKVDGVAFRLIPELSQIKNAIKVMQMNGLSDEAFLGVPVFQSKSLILRSQSRSYHPVFFRKEDLENSLFRASRQQNRLNPAFRQGDIQVAVLEEIIKGMKPSVNTIALAGQESLALVVVNQNEESANVNTAVESGGVLQAHTVINSTKRLEDDLQSLGLKIKQHEDNMKTLKAQKYILDDSILDKQVILGQYRTSAASGAAASTEDNSPSNGGEEETTKQIMKNYTSAAGIWCHLKNSHGTQAPILSLSEEVIGIVATLGQADDKNLSRLLSEYLGVETMLTIVCKTPEGIKALERYAREGSIDKSAGLHGLCSSIGKILNGRCLVICIEDLMSDDGQRRLDLFQPRYPSGECPPGFLGFAVNMVNIDATHLVRLTASGRGLRETLFHRLFSRTQVYSTRTDMLLALPLISGGAISLDGGIIRGPGVHYLGKWDDVDVRPPVPSDASGHPTNYHEVENKIKDMKWKREKLREDLQRERQMLDHAKLHLERKKQEFVMFLAQSSPYAAQVQQGNNP